MDLEKFRHGKDDCP